MKAIIYSNRNQECERAQSFLESCHLDETIVYYLDKDFTIRQFKDEVGDGAEFPQKLCAYIISRVAVFITSYIGITYMFHNSLRINRPYKATGLYLFSVVYLLPMQSVM